MILTLLLSACGSSTPLPSDTGTTPEATDVVLVPPDCSPVDWVSRGPATGALGEPETCSNQALYTLATCAQGDADADIVLLDGEYRVLHVGPPAGASMCATRASSAPAFPRWAQSCRTWCSWSRCRPVM